MQKRLGRIFGVIAVLVLCLGAGWYISTSSNAQKTSTNIQVVATFFPLADFAKTIGGSHVDVIQITPDGVEVHEYEPSPQDVATLLSADVVLVNGGGVDAWADDVLVDAQALGVTVVRMSDVVPFIEHDGVVDPHAWLDLARAQEMVRAMGEALISRDSEHAAEYARNTNALQADLAELDERFQTTLASCQSRTIFVAHDAFSYWALRYNVDVHAVSGISPEAEPSVQDLANIIREAKELQVTTIFFESPASTALATTIADEIGVAVDVLNPLEGRTPEQGALGATYLTLMQENLNALSRALTCQQ
ncbi:MAG: zinc ABC transporter substrate-binding protein [Patescibacteria group bacterium]